MSFNRFLLAIVVALLATSAIGGLRAQQAAFTIDGDNVTMRGCVRQAGLQPAIPATVLIWSRSDIMLAGVTAANAGAPTPVGTSGLSEQVFYWLEDDDDLSKHVGQWVEVKGDLKDLEIGKVEIDRDGDFTEIEVKLDGKNDKARVPTSWLRGTGADNDREFKIVARRIDVDDVRALGACNLQ
jgi:hypothetical protein